MLSRCSVFHPRTFPPKPTLHPTPVQRRRRCILNGVDVRSDSHWWLSVARSMPRARAREDEREVGWQRVLHRVGRPKHGERAGRGSKIRGEGCEDFLCAFGHLDQCSGLVKIGDAEAHNQIFRTSFDLEEAIQCSCIGQAAQRGLSRGGVDDR